MEIVIEDVFYITNRYIDSDGSLNNENKIFKIESIFDKNEVDNYNDNINIIVEKNHFYEVLGINYTKPLIGDLIIFNSNKKYIIKRREKLNENDIKFHILHLKKDSNL